MPRKAPKVTPDLPLVQLREGGDDTYIVLAKTLWDELCRFEKLLDEETRINRDSKRYTRMVGAITTLKGLFECQHPQTPGFTFEAAPKD